MAQKIEQNALHDSIRADALTIQAHAILQISPHKDTKKAIYTHQKALELRRQAFGQQSKEVAYSLINLGNTFWENLQEGQTALPYYLQAIQIWETYKLEKSNTTSPFLPSDYDTFLFGNTERIVADIYLLQRDFPLAQQFSERATTHLVWERGEWLFAAHLALMKALFYNDRKSEALNQAEKVQNINLTTEQKATLYGAMADCLMDKNSTIADKSNALIYYKKALFFLTDKTAKSERSKYFNKLGSYYLALEKKDSALFYFKNALNVLPKKGFSDLQSVYLTNIGNVYRQSKQFDEAQKYYTLSLAQAALTKTTQGETLDALTELAYAYSDQALQNNNWQAALNAYIAAIEHLETYQNQLTSTKSALILRGYYYPLFGCAAEACVHLGQAQQALIWAERGKAFLLKAQSSLTLQDIQNELVNTKKRFLIYSFGRQSLTIFVVTATQFYPLSIETSGIAENVKKLFETIRARPQNGSGFFHEEAHFLYQKLIAQTGIQRGEDLTIVPDGILHYLPFEVLLTEKPKTPTRFNLYAYLLNAHTISYRPSAFWTAPNKEKTAGMSDEILAFAPSFNQKHQDLEPLLHNQREVDAIGQVWRSKILRGGEATKNNFIDQVEHHKLIHISTHGIPDGDYPENSYLAFSNDRNNNGLFYISDLDSLKLNADLVVLSACETAFGRYYGGEGPMSIARAFLASGSKGVVATLWQVNDNLTTDLMTTFYTELKQGVAVEAALQTAKKQFAEGEKANPAHPYFWAAFTFSGDNAKKPINTEGVFGRVFFEKKGVLGIILLIAVAVFYLYFRFGQNSLKH
ncbi:MAG: CHAT domain-containing tetratricopeptide repeat protein [Saprospiraceae bacterium]|nr:CHAT domain-containing tetratricopeptide repeat protein [Saprospiraceae bacterium]